MRILFYLKSGDPAPWLAELAARLPQARIRAWQPGDDDPADYALVWKPPAEMLRSRVGLKAVFNLGAGVDALLNLLHTHPEILPPDVPLIKLDDAGMGSQMVEYVTHAVLRRFRRFDEYERLKGRGIWHELALPERATYTIGVMGLGLLGAEVAASLARLGFPVRGWSRSAKTIEGITPFAGDDGFAPFLEGLHGLVNLLPLTPATENILNHALFARLAHGAHVINIARGAHLAEQDLLEALDSGQLGWATLDVFRQEPLPAAHPFWRASRLDLTPHVSALTERTQSVRQIAERISALEQGIPVSGIVDRARGY